MRCSSLALRMPTRIRAIALAAVALAGCAPNDVPPDVTQLAPPERWLMMPACHSPEYPRDEGNPDVRARWQVADAQCDSANRQKVEGLQQYARAVSGKSKKR